MTRFRTSPIVWMAVLAAAAALPAATALAVPAAAATTYAITNMGSLGDGGTTASAINATGQVTGYSTLSTTVPTPECPPVYGNTKKTCVEHPWHAFLYSNGKMTDLGTLGGGDFSEGNAINASGWVAGWSAAKNGAGHAVLWNGAKMLDIGQQAPLNGSGSSSTANGINDAGQVVGYYGSGSGSAAFLYSNGAVTSLPDPSFAGSDGCQAFAINNTGQIAGTCRDTAGVDHLVLWHNGTVTDLGTMTTPGNWSFTRAVSMNNNGQIAASVFIGGGTTEGFLYSNGALTSLGSFLPAAINDSGVMVGGPDIDSGSTVQDLNTMVPAGSPAIQDAATINVNGQIVSDGLLLNPS